MSLNMKSVFEALLPPGAIWVPKPGGDFDRLLDGIGDNAQEVYDFLEALAHIRDPRQTSVLSDLEKEYGVLNNKGLTEAERREQLAGIKYAKPTTASFDHMQDNLRAAGYSGIIVTPNDPAIDPALITGDLIVNGPIYIEQDPAYLMQAGGDFAYAGNGRAVAGYFLVINRTLYEYSLPSQSQYWRFIFFVGGAASGWPGSPAIAQYNINYKRVTELIRLILKYKPEHSWAVLVINDIMVWIEQTSASGFISNFEGAAWGNGLFVVTGSSGEIQTSDDGGSTWTRRDADGSYSGILYGITYGDGKFVTVGESGEIQTSPDGVNWTAQTAAGAYSGTFKSVYYANGLFVAVGASGEIQTSPDGVNWTAQTAAGAYSGTFNGITWGDGLWCAVGSSAEIQTSPDGMNWTAQTPGGAFALSFLSVTFGNHLFVTVGQTGQVQTSPDGVTWTVRTTAGPFFGTLNQAIFGSNRFVIIGTTGEIQSSEDGITWKAETAAGGYSSTFKDGIHGANKFLICGNSAEIQTDG